jgi:LysR family transcriptional regulator, glycine cleavage system transcriptional activator
MLSQLDLQQLRMFFTLSQTGSYTATAQRLHRTQSAVSHAIRKLEQSVGVALVEKRGADFQLSEAGRRLYTACETTFYALEGAVEDIARNQGSHMGRIRIGATVEFGCSILMQHMEPFLKENAQMDVEFYLRNELLSDLQRDGLDLIIDCKEHRHPDLNRVPLFTETYLIIAAPSYLRHAKIKTIEDLSHAAIISFDRKGSWWHRLLNSLPTEQRPEFSRIIPINHIRGMIVAAEHGIGVALVPKYSIQSELAARRLKVVFPKLSLNEDQFCIYQKASRKHLVRHKLVIDYLQKLQPAEFV